MKAPQNRLRASFLIATIVIIFLVNCGKNNDAPPQSPPKKVDTLAAGWSKTNLGQLTDFYFANQGVGYAGWKNLFKTFDGGVSWKALSLPAGSPTIYNMFFFDENTGWLVGGNDTSATLLRTTDGGANFQKISVPSATYMADIQFINKQQGYLVSNNKFFRSIDSGKTWTSSAPFQSPATTLLFTDTEKGIVVTSNSVYQTSDGGNSFKVTNTFPNRNSILGIYFSDANVGWVPNTQGYLSTKDGGATWNQVAVPGNSLDIHFFNDKNGYLLQRELILKTEDGGKSFVPVVKPAYSFLLELQFVDERHGWALSEGGNLYRYNQP